MLRLLHDEGAVPDENDTARVRLPRGLVKEKFAPGVWAVVWTGVEICRATIFPLILSWMTRITGENSSLTIAFTMASGTLEPVLLGGVTGFLGATVGMQYIMLLPLACFVGFSIMLAVFGRRCREALN